MKLNYKRRLLLWFGIIFLAFAVGLSIFEQSQSTIYKTEALEEKLDAYADLVIKTVSTGESVDSLLAILPHNIRITLIDSHGVVTYDNAYKNLANLENHGQRPEILSAKENNKGTFIRKSATNGKEYLYYAKSSGDSYVRVALPYDIEVKHFLRADNGFLYFTILLFGVALLFINYAAGIFGKSIRQLRDFTLAAEENKFDDTHIKFPKDELGEIGERVVKSYKELETSKKQISQEREKLLQHIQSSEEGVCFFSSDRKVEYYNGLFMQYLSILIDVESVEPLSLFSSEFFADVTSFLSENSAQKYLETKITKQGKDFSIQVNVFEDKSFEIIIHDITKQEKTRRLKQEITGNVAHELRTPVTSIRGYLETILEQHLDPDKERHFITKAYRQVMTLSELIRDMSLITKIEDAPNTFPMEKVNLLAIVEKVEDDLHIKLAEQRISLRVNIPSDTVVRGNANLLHSVFRNLMDNVINHAGAGVNISVSRYNSDHNFHYFSFSDDGIGIENEQHLNRLFERFYRITEGRTRDSGGSGLGLSIVKNAIAFHKGSIAVKNRPEGGLEFLFKLPK